MILMLERSKTVAIIAFVLVGILSVSGTAASEASGIALTRGPYLQRGTPNSISIVWRTVGNMQPVIRFGSDASTLNRSFPMSSIVVRTVYPQTYFSKGRVSFGLFVITTERLTTLRKHSRSTV